MVIKNLQTAHAQAGLSVIEIYLDRAVRDSNHPKHIVRVDVHVVVVNLLGKNGRSDRTGIQIKSNKSESSVMVTSIGADELALAKTHVSPERQRCRRTRGGVRSGPAAVDVCQTNVAIEIGDLRRITEATQGIGRVQRVMMDKDPKRRKGCAPAWNRVGPASTGTLVFVFSMCRSGPCDPHPENRGRASDIAEEEAP